MTVQTLDRSTLDSKKRSLLLEAGVILAIALVLLLVMPMVLTTFRLNLLGRFLSLAIVALGIDLIWGFTGMLSLGHGVFFTLGGYALAMHLKLQIPANASSPLPEFMNLYGVTELPAFWQPFYSFTFSALMVVVLPANVNE